MNDREAVGIVGQWVGMLCCVAGLLGEVVLGGEWYLVLITAGSLLWGVATKVRHGGGSSSGGEPLV